MRVPAPFSNYSSTRLSEDEQTTVNMFPHSVRGWRQFPGLVSFGSISNTAVKAQEYDVSSQNATNIHRVFVDKTGERMYDANLSTVYQYSLSDPFRVSSATYDSKSFDYDSGILAMDIDVFYLSDDGTKAYFSATVSSTARIYEVDLGSAFDISTATYNSNFKQFGAELGSTSAPGIHFSPDGTRLMLLSSTGILCRYDLTTAWDITTATYASDTANVTAQVSTAGSLSMSDDGTKLRAFDTGADVETYTMTAWDLSTLTHSAGLGLTVPGLGGQFRNNDRRFYATDDLNDEIEEYSLGGTGRGMIVMAGIAYAVVGSTLYSIDTFGAATAISGTIADAPGIVGMETDGTQLVITSGTTIYRYTVAGGLTTVTDADITDTAKTSAYLDLKFWLDQPSGKFIGSTNNDATAYSTDDLAEAESFGDDTLAVYAHNQLLYICGETSMEVWYTSGEGRPPVTRQQVIERGIIGSFAIGSIDDRIYFVDQERRVNVMTGLQYQAIVAPGLDKALSGYTTVSDCIVNTYSLNRENFVDVFLPTENITWTYHEVSGEWVKRSGPNIVGYANVYGLLLGLGADDGKVYKFSDTTYQNNGASITRTKDIGPITAELYDPALTGTEVICNGIDLTFESSTGSQTVTVTLAKDGGSFGQSRTITLGAGVQSRKQTRFGKFREGIFRVTTTGNAKIDLMDAGVDLDVIND
jgi:hypothetical protein